ncbi:MAG TPA: FUSC family protein [Mycobacteriales bacterium]
MGSPALGGPATPRTPGRQILRDVVRLDHAQFTPGAGARGAVGLTVPLVLGLLLGHPAEGAAAATGALLTGFVSFQGVYRSRAWAMLLTALGMGVTTLLGEYVGQSVVTDLLLAAVGGLLVGMAAALGPIAAAVSRFWLIALLVGTGIAGSIGSPLGHAALVVAGGLLQTLIVVVLWPLRRSPAERRAIARLYWDLSAYAQLLPAARWMAPSDPAPFAAAAAVLADPQPWALRGDGTAFRELYDEAERIRLSLAALAADRDRLHGWAPEAVAAVDHLTEIAAEVLAAVAEAVQTGRAVSLPAAREAALDADAPAGLPAEVTAVGARLRGQLRAVSRIAPTAALGWHAPVRRDGRPQPFSITRDALLALRANLTPHSAVFRHAIRLSGALMVATVVSHVLPVERGYWLPLTVLVVLQPDFGATFTRGVARVAGTVLGVAVVTALLAALQPGPALLVVLTVLLGFAAMALFRVSFAAFSACVTAVITVLLAFAGLPGFSTVVDRLIDTVAGGAIAMLAYLVWPTWEAVRLRRSLALLLEAQGRYGAAVLRAYADPEARDVEALRRARLEARLARTNAEASVNRAFAEPRPHRRVDPEVALGTVAAVRRYALAVLALHGHLPTASPVVTGRLDGLADAMEATLTGLAAALRDGAAYDGRPPLRELHRELVTATGGDGTTVLATETDTVVDAVDSVAELLSPNRA